MPLLSQSDRFNYLTKIETEEPTKVGYSMYKCIYCNKQEMRNLLIKRNFKHGKARSKTHTCWLQMKRRCKGLTNRSEFYKDKGISYPEEWEDFSKFLLDMGECPDNYSLERLDVNKSYSKNNCIWADNKTQANNKTNNIVITNREEVMSLKHWCDSLGLEYRTQFARFRYGGKTIEQILGRNYRLAKDKFDI